MKTYIVNDDGNILQGTAHDILQRIIDKSPGYPSDISGMSVDIYAETLIRNAPYFVPKMIYDGILPMQFESDADKALIMLSNMPASGTVLLPEGFVAATDSSSS